MTQPHPPVLIGCTGTRTLRLVARYGDACHLFGVDDDGTTICRKLAVLAGHCARIGRPDHEITKTFSTRLHPDDRATRFVDRAGRLAKWGTDHLIVLTDGPWTTERVTVLADATQQLTDTPSPSSKETP